MTAMTMTRRATLGLALGGAVTATMAHAAGRLSAWAGVDAAAARLIADRAAPGLSVSVFRQGKPVYSRGFGSANLEALTPATPTTVYKIGSVTKQFTAAALLLLAEDGKLSIDDSFARFFPDFPRGNEITLRQMMSHTAGLGNYTNTPREVFNQRARTDYDAVALYRLMTETRPLYIGEPGSSWAYSNTGYVLLGLLVEKVAGEPYGAFFKRRLFDPAGMADSAVDDAADVVPRRAAGYTPSSKPGGFANASFISMTLPGGAGSIRSTTEDLCRWHTALFEGKVFAAASLAQMTAPHRLKDGTLPIQKLAPGGPRPVEYGFGLGFEEVEGHRMIGHNGSINGFGALVGTFPDRQVSFAMIVNCDGGPKLAPDMREIRGAIAKAVPGLP